MSPKVSVVTCSYNRPALLRGAVESLRRQTDSAWEHLIYDDASTHPGIPEVLRWAEEDPRVRVFRRASNLDRPSVLWNFLRDRDRGRYYTVLDDDNEKLPRFVEAMAGELDADPSLGAVTCGFLVRAPGQADWEHHHNLRTTPEEVERASTCEGGALLCRRETFEEVGYFSEAIRTNEDWDWVRRAVRSVKIKNLPECLTVYRQHEANRQLRAEALGHSADVALLRQRPRASGLGIRLIYPSPKRLTCSQLDVIGGASRALAAIPWAQEGTDLAVILAPFQVSDEEAVRAVSGCARTLLIHMEDPYALGANLNRVRALVKASPEVWVSTNDRSTVSHYRDFVGDRVILCPSLGADSTVFPVPPRPSESVESAPQRDIDVLLCGYAYPSRKRFVGELLPLLGGLRVLLVGDGWEGYPAETMPTQGLEATYALHARTRAVVCLHRVHGDCADGPVEPETANRGFMEGALGPRVFLDRSRPHHPYEPGDVVFFHEPGDLAGKLHVYLARDPAADRFAEKCRLLYTYRTRLARILNCVRAPRFLAEIP